ncbi:putative quinol monooxygenase [Parasphingorhabdus litoris]|uniref:Quinol monooxygenase n=1 Tax=Parasphingorhabdus litoris TaxID=394733 RepID=A0ABN1A3G9_9SPHN|nr:putative quinol monooxygenase [Parasphingorhabdus litoris]
MTNTLFGFAKITPKSEHHADAQNAILAIVEETRAEPGCIQFTVLADSDQGHIFLYEEWQDEAALKEHHGKPYTKAVMDNYDNWLAEPLRFETMAKLI